MECVPGCEACKDRQEYYKEALKAYLSVYYLFEKAKRSFTEVIDSDETLCPGCKFWLKTRYGLGVRE